MSAGCRSVRISRTRSVRSSSSAARTSWALSGCIFFLRTLVATVLTPAGRGRQSAPRNFPSVEADGEIEKHPVKDFRGPTVSGQWEKSKSTQGERFQRAGSQLPARVMDPIRIEPVRMLPLGSTSLPTAASPRNMSLRLPAR